MTSPQPAVPRRVRQYRGLLGRCAFLVPAILFGAWRLAGAQEGPHSGDMASFASLDVLVFAGLLSVAAIVSKQACVLGVFKRGLNRWAVGVGMIPRGEVGLIFASIGHTVLVAGAPVLSDNTFSAIVAMVMVTTLVTPPLLKAAFAEPSAENEIP